MKSEYKRISELTNGGYDLLPLVGLERTQKRGIHGAAKGHKPGDYKDLGVKGNIKKIRDHLEAYERTGDQKHLDAVSYRGLALCECGAEEMRKNEAN